MRLEGNSVDQRDWPDLGRSLRMAALASGVVRRMQWLALAAAADKTTTNMFFEKKYLTIWRRTDLTVVRSVPMSGTGVSFYLRGTNSDFFRAEKNFAA